MGNSMCKPSNDTPLIKLNLNCMCIKGSENEIDYHDNVDGEEKIKEKENNKEKNKKEKPKPCQNGKMKKLKKKEEKK